VQLLDPIDPTDSRLSTHRSAERLRRFTTTVPDVSNGMNGKRSLKRRAAISTLVASLMLGGGGVAVAATGNWGAVQDAWAHLQDKGGAYTAGTPTLVAESAGPTGDAVQLWSAANDRGGNCVSVRTSGYSSDKCSPTQPLRVTVGDVAEPVVMKVGAVGSVDQSYLYGSLPYNAGGDVIVLTNGGSVTAHINADTHYWVVRLPQGTVAADISIAGGSAPEGTPTSVDVADLLDK